MLRLVSVVPAALVYVAPVFCEPLNDIGVLLVSLTVHVEGLLESRAEVAIVGKVVVWIAFIWHRDKFTSCSTVETWKHARRMAAGSIPSIPLFLSQIAIPNS